MDKKVISRKIGDITCLEVFIEDGNSSKPLVILQHGWTSRKEDMLPLSNILAENGYYVVLPDAYRHGQRSDGELLHDSKGIPHGFVTLIENMAEIYIRTAKDFDQIIDEYRDRAEMDANRVGIAGVSMGGIIVFEYLFRHIVKNENRIKAAVPMISIPFAEMLITGNRLSKLTSSLNLGQVFLTESEEAKVQEFISTHQKGYANLTTHNIPTLMLNTGDDPIMPIDCVKEAFELLKSDSNSNFILEMQEFSGGGHEVSYEMSQELIKWFKKYL